jgi:hypothetical protein
VALWAFLMLAIAPASIPTSALAASAPSATTGPAAQVSFSSATLEGAVNPKGSDTLYYFQYGPTKAYGLQTEILDAGSGVQTMHVSTLASGLQPANVYHYRLVAVNSLGAGMGADRTFTTTRVPLSLQILASPNPTPFGGAITVEGTLSGSGNGNREVVLQANAFPFTAGFADVGNPEVTSAEGSFAFHVLSLRMATEYRVVTTTSPVVMSPTTTESVTPRIRAQAHRLPGRAARGRFRVRFTGTVAPALNGRRATIVHVVRGHNVFVASVALRKARAHGSRFNLVVRARRGVYRVQLRLKGGPLSATESGPLIVR